MFVVLNITSFIVGIMEIVVFWNFSSRTLHHPSLFSTSLNSGHALKKKHDPLALPRRVVVAGCAWPETSQLSENHPPVAA
jgi:hypothetical protein